MHEPLLIADQHAAQYADELRRRGLHVDISWVANAADAHALAGQGHALVLAQPDLGAALLRAGARPRWLQSTWAGVRPLAEAVLQLGIADLPVTGLRDVFGAQISEYVFAHVLADVRGLDQARADQAAQRWQPRWSRDLRDCTMVVVGTGSIGAHVARSARHFRMRVLGVSLRGRPVDGFERCVPVSGMHDALGEAQFVVATLPDTAATTQLFDPAAFAAMRADAVFINVGRGATVDVVALRAALLAGRLRAAVLDVFAVEPLPADDPLWVTPGVTITPHVAAVSQPRDVINCFAANLARWRRGATLVGQVDPQRGY